MYGTTFPPPGGGDQSASAGGPATGGWSGQKKPWTGEKKPWDGERKSFKRDESDITLYLPYAVAGNKDMPQEIVDRLVEVTKQLDAQGYTVRIGGTDPFEDAIEKVVKNIEVHLPFRGFNNKESKFSYVSDRAKAVASMFHPTFESMSKGVQTFLAKNARLILGDRMNQPALFLLVWTEDGADNIKKRTAKTGFAGHPIAIASSLPIPIFNLASPDAERRLMQHLAERTPPSPATFKPQPKP